MNYWLMKTEPGAFSWQDLVRDGQACWDGVRNYQARNNMKAMKKGDQVLIYHSVNEKTVTGIATVSKEAYQDPTTPDDRWVAVDVKPLNALKSPISLKEIKNNIALSDIPLVKHSRLSVMPLNEKAFNIIIAMSEK